MRPVFLNTEQQQKIEYDGFVVVPFLTTDEVDLCSAIYKDLEHESPTLPFYTSHWSTDKQHRKRVNDRLRPILSKNLHPLLRNYRDLYSYFLVKEPSPESFFRVHQDWTLVDETQFTGITAWCPLADTVSHNGAFHIVQGSHRFLGNIRGENIDMPYRDILSYIECQFTTPVYLKAGEALVFDQRLWHFSPANMDTKKRVAVGIIMVPKEAPIRHYKAINAFDRFDYQAEIYQPDDDFLLTNSFGGSSSPYPKIGETRLPKKQLTEVEFDRLYGSNFRSNRPVFQEPNLEHEFFEKGYFTTQLLNNAQIEKCKEAYKNADKGQTEIRYNSLEITEGDHREKIKTSLEQIIGDSIKEKLLDYKFIAFNMAVKKVDENTAFDAHIDDIHVNEAEANSVNVWIPLVDVNETNGALYLVPKSHKLPQPLRGIGVPFVFKDKLHLIEKHKVTLNLKAGEALFFHTKMIHGSPGNKSDSERPAIITGLIPDECEPIVFMNHDQLPHGKTEKFHAPEEFYLNLQIDKRPENFKSLGIYDIGSISLSDDEFESIICH
jgi:ectoine hydroxylase-related dioxygenase (phytanoyl-CoA dioxygenase family)